MGVAKTPINRGKRLFIPNYPKGVGGGIPSSFSARVSFGGGNSSITPPDWSPPLVHQYYDGKVFSEVDPTTLTVEEGNTYTISIIGSFNKPLSASLMLGFSRDGGTTIEELAEIKNYVYAEGEVVLKSQITLAQGDVFTLHVSSDSAATVSYTDLEMYLTVD